MAIDELLDRKYAIDLLMKVHTNPGRCGKDYYETSRTRFKALMHLKEHGLIRVDEDPRMYNTHIWYCTAKGDAIATHLESIDRWLEMTE